MTAWTEWLLLAIQATMAGAFGHMGWRLLDDDRRARSLHRLEERSGAFAGSLAAAIVGIAILAEADAVRIMAGLQLTDPLFRSLVLTGYGAVLVGLGGITGVLAWSHPGDPDLRAP